jgi:predicted nucleotidyltransferase
LLPREDAALLESPNNILGVEYCKSLLRRGSTICPLTVPRRGAAHHSAVPEEEGAIASAGAIRALVQAGEEARALSQMAPAMAEVFQAETAAGRAPVLAGSCERAVLARLRSMSPADFAAIDEGREGLCNRLYRASRTAPSLAALLEGAKTKRYAYARLRRMVLWAYLGLTPGDMPETVPYLRVLAANGTGRALLGQMRQRAAVPVLTKPADVRRLSREAQALFAMEVRATDLYTLAYPAVGDGGGEWTVGPVLV